MSTKHNIYQVIHSGEHIHTHQMNNSEDTTALEMISKRHQYSQVKKLTFSNTSGQVALWGEKNILPQIREALIQDNNIVGELIKTRRDLLLGAGIKYFKKIQQDNQIIEQEVLPPPVISDWVDKVDLDEVLECAAGEYIKHGNLFYELTIDKGGMSISNLWAKPCVNIRAAAQDKSGKIPGFYYSTQWLKSNSAEDKVDAQFIPTYGQPSKGKAMIHTGDKLMTDGYYFIPAWWGGRHWVATANRIPKFHQANLDNGYVIRYHIKIPHDYFLDKAVYDKAQGTDKDDVLQASADKERAFVDKMNGFLAGAKNSGRAVYTKYMVRMEKEHPGIKIEPLSVDMKDEALLKLYDKSNDANISGQGVHPVLASIQTQGKLSSGSDIRNALLLHIATKLPVPRKNILKVLDVVKKRNGWPDDICFGFKDKLITTLDVDKSGTQSPTDLDPGAEPSGE